MEFLHGRTVDAVNGWLRSGQPVLLRGDMGSGRSTVVRHLAEELRASGGDVVVLRGSHAAADLPLAAFQTHLQLGSHPPRWGLQEAVRALQDAIPGRGVVLLDDLHLLDRSSLAAVSAFVAQAAEPVLVVATVPLGADLGRPARELVRGAALETVEPLDVSGVAALLFDVLGGQFEFRLATSLAGRSGGNPRVVTALAAAALRTGTVSRVHSRWVQASGLDVLPADAVVHGLTGDLSPELLDGLDALAWFGLLDVSHARRMLGDDVLAGLLAHGRVVIQERGRSSVVAVHPPALAQGLRLRMSPAQRAGLRARLGDAGETGEAAENGPGGGVPELAVAGTPARAAEIAQVATVLRESVRTQAAVRRRDWEASPTVGCALPVLRLRLLDDVTAIDADEVFAHTVPDAGDDPDDLAAYVLLRGLWSARQGHGLRAGLVTDPSPSGRLVVAGVDEAFLDALVALHETGRVDGRLDDLDDDPGIPAPWREHVRLTLANADIEAGAPDTALERLGAWAEGRLTPLGSLLDAARGEALLAVGQVDDAVSWFRARLSDALDTLDFFAARLAARGLASAQILAGDDESAFRSVALLVSLGRCGAVHAPYDERIFGIAAILSARAGDVDVARSLLDELEHTARPYVLPLDVWRAWARIEVSFAVTGGVDGEAERMWAAGEEHLAAGRPVSAAACWSLAPAILPDDRLDRLESVVRTLNIPLLRMFVALHRALAHGSGDDILHLAEAMRLRGPLASLAVTTARDRAKDDARSGVEARIDRLVRTGDVRRSAGVAARATLTEREDEIASLARDGLSNRDIASRLFLSVRTVESHLYRAMRKLGVSDRTGLRDALAGAPELGK